MSPWGASRCPLDRGAFTHMPAVCKAMHAALALALPEAYAARAAEAEAEEARIGAASEDCGRLPSGRAVQASDLACAVCGDLLHRPVALNCGCAVCLACVPGGRACPVCASAAVVAPPRVCALLSDMVGALFPAQAAARAAAAGDGDGSTPSTPAAPASADDPTSLSAASFVETHPGVGCDACGCYPIRGRRYQCSTCAATQPRGMGYDLCGACHDAGVAGSRFGGPHAAGHALELVPTPRSHLHTVAAAHPELSMQQVLALVALSREGGPDRGGDPDASVVELELDPDRLPPGFPPDLASIDALEAFFGRVEAAGGLEGVDGETREVLERFFPDVLRFMREGGGGDGDDELWGVDALGGLRIGGEEEGLEEVEEAEGWSQ